MKKYRSWGYVPDFEQASLRPAWRDEPLDTAGGSLLPYGNGRSYGDSCLNREGRVIDCRSLDRFIDFDTERGILRCEAGVSFEQILETIVPRGWFLPVSPGTKFVTLGGAIANDVHGKNHHRDGTLGCHVLRFELLRSDGERLLCSPDSNDDLFRATIGGLGLTGLITWAEIRLLAIRSPFVEVETIPFRGLEEFYGLSANSQDYRYTVAWLDCIARGDDFARGLFMRGNHIGRVAGLNEQPRKLRLSVPFNAPRRLLNRYTTGLFNAAYYHLQRRAAGRTRHRHYDPFFYPLDGIDDWNRIYGRDGFFQYQFVVPRSAKPVMEKLLDTIVSSGLGSFLAVLKEFGDLESPGMLSFPRPGICLALDLANRGGLTRQVLDGLDELVMAAGGAVYPAKDNRMSAEAFRTYYPRHRAFSEFVDPRFSSDFWKRVNER